MTSFDAVGEGDGNRPPAARRGAAGRGGLVRPPAGLRVYTDQVEISTYREANLDPVMYHEHVPDASLPEENKHVSVSGSVPVLPLLVGMGDQCETEGWLRVGACDKCGYEITLSQSSCGRIECPRCMHTWARRASERSGARVWGAFHAGVVKYHPRHITFELNSMSWDEAKTKAVAIGCTGGVIVMHPYRIKREYKQMFEIMAARCSMNRYDVARESAYGLSAFDYSPHAHVITYGRLVDIEKGSNEYLYKNIRRLNSQAGVERTLSYLLGHTSMPESPRKSVVRYFGICSPQKLKPSWTGKSLVAMLCPCCGGHMIEKGTMDMLSMLRYIALGWHVVTGKRSGAKGRPARGFHWTDVQPELPAGLCTFS